MAEDEKWCIMTMVSRWTTHTHVDSRGGGVEQGNHERQHGVAEIGGTGMAAT